VKKEPWRGGERLILWISFSAIVVMSCRLKADKLVTAGWIILASAAVLALLPRRWLALQRRCGWRRAAAMALFALAFGLLFRSRWMSVTRFLPMARRLGLPWSVLVNIASAGGMLLALPFLSRLFLTAGELVSRAEAAAADRAGRLPARWAGYFLVLAVVWLQYYQMQFGVALFPQSLYGVRLEYFLLDLCVFLAVNLVLALLLGRWSRALLAGTALFTVWGVANFYVYRLHGSPLYLSELANTGTALNVLSNYRVRFTNLPFVILGLAVLALRLLRALRRVESCLPAPRRALPARLGLLTAEAALIALVFFRPGAGDVLGWSNYDAISRYGFAPCVVDDIKHMARPFRIPPGYRADALPAETEIRQGTAETAPDIILILNESFCDLDDYTELRADRDFLAPFYSIPGAVYGHAVTPSIGGGTNNSEYELLTANSMYLISAPAPFNFIDFTRRPSNAVQYLKRLGYSAFAMHIQSASNYARSTAYPALGFDDTLLGWESWPDFGRYGNRVGLDANYYQAMLHRYGQYETDAPRFLYVLTFQNHGGYEKNDAALDTVRVGANFGDLTDDVEEFLTSVSLAGEAFRDLTETLSAADRPVIVCMVGDHCPSFLPQLPAREDWSELEEQIAQRVVPYVMWSNYGADFSGCTEYMSMFGLMPEVIRAAGLPLTQYYRTILALKERFPVVAANGVYADADGVTGLYEPEDPACGPITEYLHMEYNAVAAGMDYRDELFLPPLP